MDWRLWVEAFAYAGVFCLFLLSLAIVGIMFGGG